MKAGFYLKIAWNGMWKNKRLYVPYILTCIGMIMMYYILSFLVHGDMVDNLQGGATIRSILDIGCGVIILFAAIFLFYTNSFLVRGRKREFGLYNVLGMGKRSLSRVLLWESVLIAVFALAGGLGAGIALSKLAELGLANLVQGEVTFTMHLEYTSILETIKLFAVIFLILLLNTIRQIHLARPVELLKGGSTGEKPPRANWILALAGVLLLAGAYYIAVVIRDPLGALTAFFVAVVMVIVATEMIFISGSVAVCRALQKKKDYYYQANHFVSVSSMAYRMKRNGASLASICILCTMVLVMLSGVGCLYIGAEDSIRNRYPRNISLDAAISEPEEMMSEEAVEITRKIRKLVVQSARAEGLRMENILDYCMAGGLGWLEEGNLLCDQEMFQTGNAGGFENAYQIYFVSIDDYNRLMGEKEKLLPGEVILYSTGKPYTEDLISINHTCSFHVKKQIETFKKYGVETTQMLPSIYLFMPDVYETAAPLTELLDERGVPCFEWHWFYGMDLSAPDSAQIRVQTRINNGLAQLIQEGGNTSFRVQCEGSADGRTGFYELYGGLLFLGILLGLVFLSATVLMMYYKQISEGYEDQSRFEIMQKLGMTRQNIRRSINSQVLIVFFLPLLMAGMHLAFAFPLMRRLLLLFAITNYRLLIMVTGGCFLVFALFYVFTYHLTSRAYYRIVCEI